MKRAAVLLVPVVFLAASPARSDCGSIPYKGDVQIFEPNQRAVIAWNGREEILLLSTDLRASEPTKVLEVIPLPTEPEVTKGEMAVFSHAARLIQEKLHPRSAKGMGFGAMGDLGGTAMGGALPPAGEVTQQKKIGAQDISVIRVLDPRRFVRWVEDYLQQAGVENPTISRPMRRVVEEYLRDGFPWFAFNVVELGTSPATKEAVQYRFRTPLLYYPLRITRAEKGNTTVRLLLISPRLVRIPDLLSARARLLHEPVRITADELRYLDKDMHGLLGKRQPMLLRMWEIKGRLSGFRRDVLTTWH